MVLGKHSGRNAFRQRLLDLGHEFKTEESLNKAFSRFKVLADKKHEIFDEDLQALVSDVSSSKTTESLKLVAMEFSSQTGETPRAELTISIAGVEHSAKATGSGPVDAAFKAIDQMVDIECHLQLYSVNAITSGTDAQGEVSVRLEQDGRFVNGHGADTDIVIASAKAYLNGLNRLVDINDRRHPQTDTLI